MIIGPSTYSKDPNIRPEGIALTLPVAFFQERGMTTDQFKKLFERYMRREDALWNFRLTNLPTIDDIAWVYLIFDKQFQYRCNFVGYERGVAKSFSDAPDGITREFMPSNWVTFTGPVVAAPTGWDQRGHQGFRYTIFLF